MLARNLNNGDSEIGGQIVYFISTMPENACLQFRGTVLELIANMSEWISYNDSHIPTVLGRLVQEIQVL